jgi:hypothetical protein
VLLLVRKWTDFAPRGFVIRKEEIETKVNSFDCDNIQYKNIY